MLKGVENMIVVRNYDKTEEHDADYVGELVAFHEFAYHYAWLSQDGMKKLGKSAHREELVKAALERAAGSLQRGDSLSVCADKYAKAFHEEFGASWEVIARHGYQIANHIYDNYDTKICPF